MLRLSRTQSEGGRGGTWFVVEEGSIVHVEDLYIQAPTNSILVLFDML